MLHTPNKKGHLPIHLLADLSLDPLEKEKIYQLLLPYMKPALPSLSTSVDFKTICHQYNILSNSPLYKTLKIACLLVNQIRQTAFLSSTHPDFNGEDAKRIDLLHQEIKDYRNEADRAKHAYLYTCKDVTYIEEKEDDDYCAITAKYTPSVRDKLLSIHADIPLAAQKGNCAELSDIFVHLLNKLNLKDMFIEIFSIINGDHCFVVLNRAPNSAPASFKTWGSRALVVDVWAGKIYPAASIPEQLCDSCSMEIRLGEKTQYQVFILPFIPGYHKLVLDANVSILEETLPIKLNPNSFVGQFVKSLNLGEKELFLFHNYIKLLLKDLIAENKLDKCQLTELEHPMETLVYTFLDPYYLKKLTDGDVNLKEIEEQHIIDDTPHPKGYKAPWLNSQEESPLSKETVESHVMC